MKGLKLQKNPDLTNPWQKPQIIHVMRTWVIQLLILSDMFYSSPFLLSLSMWAFKLDKSIKNN